MADGRHIENCFLAISRRHIGWFMQVSEWRWRITCQSLDQNGNFRKFKMADGRHFENSFISISQPRIVRFRSNLVCLCKFPFRGWLFDKNRYFCNSRWLRTPYWKPFLAISRRRIGRLMWNSEWRWRITCRYRSRDQKWKFSQIQDGGRPPFGKQFSVFTSLL